MNKIKLKKLMFIGMTLLALTGCSSAQTEEQIQSLNTQITALEQENLTLEATIKELQAELDALTVENDTLTDSVEEMTNSEYTLYSRDIDTWDIVEVGTVSVDRDFTLEEKLVVLANGLSESQFGGLPIEIQGVERINGENIAFINLRDTEEITWYSTYFQGSTGGVITNTAIEETLLQRSISEPWIDGIKMLYNNEVQETEHVILGKVIYR